uniref:ABC transporter E family member 2 n=1 Tax=Tanacetum cinerariifolium TaxID=118510 RepID=A0A6L2LCM0_TANCI|nr:hypothetical protein [Tanacetum cinerariifolium]
MATISEELCIGCGICVKKCPFNAIEIINLPKALDKETTHRYGVNTFKLHRLPIPKIGNLVGLVGRNGTGKSTALKILSGDLIPNLGRFDAIIKPQYVDHIAKANDMIVGRELEQKDERGVKAELPIPKIGNLVGLVGRNGTGKSTALKILSGDLIPNLGHFDNPPTWQEGLKNLDHELRNYFTQIHMKKLKAIIKPQYVDHIAKANDMIVGRELEHKDERGVKAETPQESVEEIQTYARYRYPSMSKTQSDFKLRVVESEFTDSQIIVMLGENGTRKTTFIRMLTPQESVDEIQTYARYRYPSMSKTQSDFKLRVVEGEFTDSHIIVMLGENGTGKTTFIRMLAAEMMEAFKVSYKPQRILTKFDGSVRSLLKKRMTDIHDSQFVSDVIKPLKIEELMDRKVQDLSYGELQRFVLCICLGKPADIYLIDEPSPYLDSKQRINASKVIRRFILHKKKTAFVIEHDFIMATYLADRVIVYEGTPSIDCVANAPQSFLTGMNLFLSVSVCFIGI